MLPLPLTSARAAPFAITRMVSIDDDAGAMRFRVSVLEEDEIDPFGQYIEPAGSENVLHGHVACDSLIERDLLHGLEAREHVKLFLERPAWFTVPTPVGEYNPDWAIVLDREGSGERVFLVKETKGDGELRPTELMKTECGRAHFQGALDVEYGIVNSLDEIRWPPPHTETTDPLHRLFTLSGENAAKMTGDSMRGESDESRYHPPDSSRGSGRVPDVPSRPR